MSRPWSACALALFCALPLSAALQVSPERVLVPPVFDRALGIPMIASNGSGYLSAWCGPSTTFVEPLDRDGTPRSSAPLPVSGPASQRVLTDITSDGTNYLLVIWTQGALTTILVDGSGQLLATTKVASSDTYMIQARIAWNGERYLLVYTPFPLTGEVVGQFLDRRGAPIGGPFTVVELDSPWVSIASNGSDFLIADFSYNICDPNNSCRIGLFTIPVSASGVVGTLNALGPTNDPYFVNHALRFTGRQYVLAWNDGLGDFRSVNEVPLAANGQPLHPAKVIATGDTFKNTTFVNLVAKSDGAVAFVQDADKVRAVRIDADGEPVDAQPIDVFDVPRPPAVNISLEAASIGTDVFAVWTQYETSASQYPSFVYGSDVDFTKSQSGHAIVAAAIDDAIMDLGASSRTQLLLMMHLKPGQRGDTLYAQRLIDGVPIGEAVALIDPQVQTLITSIASNGDDFLVVSGEFDSDGAQARTIRARLSQNGAAPANVVELGHGGDAPFAIWTGDHYLVSWTVTDFSQDSGYHQHLMVTRLDADGRSLDAAPREITAAPDFNTGFAKILATPAGLVAIFLHGTPAFFRTVQSLSHDVYASRISADGDFLGDRIAITNTPETEILVNAATDGDGHILLTWVKYPLDYHYGDAEGGALINSDLSVTRQFDLGTGTGPHTVAWTGSSFAVGWTAGQVYVQRFSREGDPTSDPIVLTGDASSKSTPLIVPTHGGAFIAYTRAMPQSSGSDAQRLVGRTIFDEVRRRAVTPR